MFASVLLLALTAAPPLPAEISAPFGHFGAVVQPEPAGGLPGNDKVLLPKWETCESQAVYLMRFLSGSARALEQLQQSLDRAPGAEKKVFGRKDVIGELVSQLSTSMFEAKRDCAEPKLLDGFKLDLTTAPKKWCDAPVGAQDGAFWFFSAKKPSVVIHVTKGAEKVCRARISAVLFDNKGVARVRIHADWAGEVSATLVGERCQNVEYTFERDRQVFVPSWKTCKR